MPRVPSVATVSPRTPLPSACMRCMSVLCVTTPLTTLSLGRSVSSPEVAAPEGVLEHIPGPTLCYNVQPLTPDSRRAETQHRMLSDTTEAMSPPMSSVTVTSYL